MDSGAEPIAARLRDSDPPEQAEDAMWVLKGEFGDKYFRDDSLIAIGATSGTN